MIKYEKAIDVSWHQGDINWQKVKNAGIKHAMIKATEGFTIQDHKFLYNWAKAQENGIQPKAYHYFKALSSTPVAQGINISNVLKQCGFNVEKDILAIDVEQQGNERATADQIAHNLYELLQVLESKQFSNIYIYCSNNYWEQKVHWQEYDFSKYPLWIAAWHDPNNLPQDPQIPTTWQNKGWAFW
ncbi:glycoside hydrolase family 25 protein [Candidatus Tisiphia endosymbiont of Nemotelus uliginosus]|uniref:glycoside hydrolase family 25 protein n=1 Tax=Candidatus Tisiphia endosymbiont of Nemotelus uliginosus TaxID=3077926 RepID=UPI0035C92FBE